METTENNGRREFIKKSAALGVGSVLLGSSKLFANNDVANISTIKSVGFAARSEDGPLSRWNFERRPLGDNDILIDIRFSGICHSDIHTIRGHWRPQQYPQIPGHEIAGIVSAVGSKVTKFKVGDKAGVGCMVDSCMTCESCKNGEEHQCDNSATVLTYGSTDKTSPSGITQGGYSNNIVVTEHFAIKIPDNIELQYAAPLLCAGITTYSPLMKADFKKGDKVGVAGIGGLGHMAIKLAVSKGAEVYAFTTTASKAKDILSWGAKEVIVVDTIDKLKPYKATLDYMISTIPYKFDVAAYASVLKPYKNFTYVGMPVHGELVINNFLMIRNRVNYNASTIGGIPETQEVIDYCAANKIYPQIEIIDADKINEAWDKVVNKEARYRYVIDGSTI